MEMNNLSKDKFIEGSPRGLYLLVVPDEVIIDFENLRKLFWSDLPSNRVLVEIRGENCASKTECLQEIATALNFPDYFGENWDALEDCLTDVNWLPSECYCLLFNHAVSLLENFAEERTVLFHILSDVSNLWRAQTNPRIFISFLICSASEKLVMQDRLKKSKVEFESVYLY